MVSQSILLLIDVAPALVVLIFVISPYDRFFRHQALFIALVGGFVVGLLCAVATSFILLDSAAPFVILVVPLIETMAKAMVLGLPRFRGREETVFLGGACGVGLAPMMLLLYGQFVRGEPFTAALLVTVICVSIGYTAVHFVSGMLLGRGPAEGSALTWFVPSYGLLLPAHLLLAALAIVGGTRPLTGHPAFAVLIAVYGLALVFAMTPALIRRALPASERARWRRDLLRRSREE